jgi:hypothetical protein
MHYDAFHARIALRCLELGYAIKPTHVGSIAGHIRLTAPDKTYSDEEIDAALRTLVKSHRSHFGADRTLSPEARLELANQMLTSAAQKQAERHAPPPLTDEEKKQLSRMTTPEQKNSFINERNYAAAELAKKKGTK